MIMSGQITEWKVEGMDCSNCAAGITRFLEKKGLEDVYVNFSTKEVRFKQGENPIPEAAIKSGISRLGYTVVEEVPKVPFWTLERKLMVSAVLTFPLLLSHLLMLFDIHIPLMHHPLTQLSLSLPVYIIGAFHFGRSALGSLRSRVPNMDVLIFLGATAAFVYSVIGLIIREPDYIFFETAATIITLVLTGNWLEKRAVQQTTSAIGELTSLQSEKARKVMPSGVIVIIDKDDIRIGDIIQINEGDNIPADGLVLSGNAWVDESMLTGESLPVEKAQGRSVIGGALLQSGNLRISVTAVGKNSVLAYMIELVKTAQQQKPDIQRLADQISAIFVPVVVSIALLTFLVGYWVANLPVQQALMNAIAVLVISCPCAMGLATPTAVMVGVGRLAQQGILVKGAQTLELLPKIKHIFFDKTGTLTDGVFHIDTINYFNHEPAFIKSLIYHLELHSSHPLAQALTRETKDYASANTPFTAVEEIRGQGIRALDAEGNVYGIGSAGMLPNPALASGATIYLLRNETLLAEIFMSDQLKSEARDIIHFFQSMDINPVIMSGDRHDKTARVAAELGVTDFFAAQLPADKLREITHRSESSITAMVGDGINDAPALSAATVGISLSNASSSAIQAAQIVLLNGQLGRLKTAMQISRHTLMTIKQNLFWAFSYNIIAIPLAAFGFLNPMWGAFFMAFSDIVVIGNSIRLKSKKID